MSAFFSFLNMGGYGIYVWPAYGLVSVFLALQLFLPWRRFRKLRQQLKASHAQTQ